MLIWGLEHFLGESRTLELPVLKTMGQIFGITALPVSIGMWVRARKLSFVLSLQHRYVSEWRLPDVVVRKKRP